VSFHLLQGVASFTSFQQQLFDPLTDRLVIVQDAKVVGDDVPIRAVEAGPRRADAIPALRLLEPLVGVPDIGE
jgi:hypothetical protein